MRRFGWLILAILAAQLQATIVLPEIFGITYYISHGELSGGDEKGDVYRPADYAFLNPFPRIGFKFDANGQYTSFEQASADAPLTAVEGTWRQEGSKIKIYQDNQQEKIKLKGNTQRIIKIEDCGCGG
jgi:hypothetical protein